MSSELNKVPCCLCLNGIRENCHHCKGLGLVPDPKEVLCNLCGECMCPIGTMNEQFPHGLYRATTTGGFDSYHLMDLITYIYSFCEKCLRQLFMKCKIKPDTVDFHDGEFPFEKDQASWELREWKRTGKDHEAYMNDICNAVMNCPNKAVYSLFHYNEFSEDCACEEHKEINLYMGSKLHKFVNSKMKVML